jgi:pilus assembly protein CpaD
MRWLGLIGIVAVVAGVQAGCRDPEAISNVRAVHLNKPEERHPIRFSSRPETLLVEIPSNGDPLSSEQRTDVYRFVRHFKEESSEQLVVSSPRAMRQHLLARKSLRDVKQVLVGLGFDRNAIRFERHAGKKGQRPILRLSYRRAIAIPPRCGNWPKDVGVDRERVPYENFGCATQRNFALTAGNGRDIMGPQPTAPRSSERRDTIWRDYVSDTAKTQVDTTAAKSQ